MANTIPLYLPVINICYPFHAFLFSPKTTFQIITHQKSTEIAYLSARKSHSSFFPTLKRSPLFLRKPRSKLATLPFYCVDLVQGGAKKYHLRPDVPAAALKSQFKNMYSYVPKKSFASSSFTYFYGCCSGTAISEEDPRVNDLAHHFSQLRPRLGRFSCGVYCYFIHPWLTGLRRRRRPWKVGSPDDLSTLKLRV